MTNYNNGFAEGFKAGWEAAFAHFNNLHTYGGPYRVTCDSTSKTPQPPQYPNGGYAHGLSSTMAGDNANNPWYAHNLGRALTPEEYAHFQGQVTGGLNLHTTTPEYDQEDASMHQTTRVY